MDSHKVKTELCLPYFNVFKNNVPATFTWARDGEHNLKCTDSAEEAGDKGLSADHHAVNLISQKHDGSHPFSHDLVHTIYMNIRMFWQLRNIRVRYYTNRQL